MKLLNKKLLSVFLCLAMICPSLNAFAYKYGTDDTEGILTSEVVSVETMPKVDFLYYPGDEDTKVDDKGTPEDDSDDESIAFQTPSSIPDEGLKAGDTFFLGVRVNKFSRYTAMSGGLKTLKLTVMWDKNYVTSTHKYEYYDSKKKNTVEAEVDHKNAYYGEMVQSYLYDIDNTYYLWEDSANNAPYEFATKDVTFTDTSANVDSDDEPIDLGFGDTALADLDGVQLGLDANTKVDVSAFPIDTQIIAILPFTVNSNVSADTMKKVIGLSTRTNETNITMGSGTRLTYNNADEPWQEYVVFDESGADIFPTTYTIEYYNGTTKVHSETVKSSDKYAQEIDDAEDAVDQPIDTNKFITSWNTKLDGSGTAFTDKTDITTLDADENHVIKVYAQTETGYAVNFYNEKADVTNTDKEPTVVYVKPVTGSKLAKTRFPDDPEKDGYGFSEWKYDNNGTDTTFDENVEIPSAGLDVWATWSAKVKVTLDLNYTGADEATSVLIDPGSKVPANKIPDTSNKKPDGYKFKEWNTKANGSGTAVDLSTATFTSSSDKNLYAIWEPDGTKPTVTIKFDKNGGDSNPPSVTINVGDSLDTMMPTDPTRTNYDFSKWNTKANGAGEDVTASTAINNTAETLGTDAFTEITPSTDPKSYEITVYAQWTPKEGQDTATVTFDKNNTTEGSTDADPKTITVVKGDPVGALPEAPTRDGYTFAGWNTQADGKGTEFKADTPVDGTKTVYAQWTENVTIKYDMNSSSTTTIDQVKDKPTTNYADPTITPTRTDGYEFVEWNTKKNGAGTKIAASTHATLADVLTAYNTDNDATGSVATLYAIWKPADSQDKVTVTFNSNNSDAASAEKKDANPATIVVKRGDAIGTDKMPDAPTRENYDFVKWTTTQNGSGGTDAVFDGDELLNDTYLGGSDKDAITVYAQWTPKADAKKTVVTFNKNNSTASATEADPATITVVSGDAIGADNMPKNPERPGYTFKEWNTASDGKGSTFDGTSTVGTAGADGTLEVFAQWTEDVTIKYDTNGGTPAITDVKNKPDTAYADPTTAVTKTGYTFKEWNTKANGSGTAIAAGDTYKTLKNVVDKYNADNGTTASEATLYAIWTAAGEKQVTINFLKNNNDDGSTEAAPAAVTINLEDAIGAMMPTAPSRTNYKLKGWNTKANGTGEAVTSADKISIKESSALKDYIEDKGSNKYELKVYAQWEVDDEKVPAANKVKVTFDGDSATKDANPKEITVVRGSKIGDAMPEDPEKDGFTFEGWYTEKNGGGTEFTGSTEVEKGTTKTELTVYAKWTENVTVKYDLNGATSSAIADAKGKKADKYSDPTAPTRTDYTFLGWNTKQNGSGTYIKAATHDTYEKVLTAYKTDNSSATGSVVTLYAQWGAVPNDKKDGGDPGKVNPTDDGIRVRFDANAGDDASVKKANPEYKYPKAGEAIGADNMPNVPTRTNYEFVSWNTKANGAGTTVDGTTLIAKSMIEDGADEVVLYAQWKVKTDEETQKKKIVVEYNKNTTAGGSTDAKPTSQEYFAGDKVINLPDEPTNGTFTFVGWNAKADGTGDDIEVGTVIDSSIDEFNEATKTITAYAQWQKQLVFELVLPESGNPQYNKEKQEPELKIYEMIDDGNGGTTKKDVTSEYKKGDDYTVTYQKEDPNNKGKGDGTDVDPINAATYILNIEMSSDLKAQGVSAAKPTPYTIDKRELDFKIINQEAKANGTNAATPPTITIETEGYKDVTYTETYKKFKPTDKNDRTIGDTDGDLETVEKANLIDVADYVLEITLTDEDNYQINSVDGEVYKTEKANDDDTDLIYAAGTKGKNIKYTILANNPKATNITIVDPAVSKYYKSDYETEKTFTVDYAEDDTSTDKDEYWVLLPKGTTSADIKIETEKYFSIKVDDTTVADGKRAADGSATVTVSDLKDVKTLKADTTATSKSNDVEIVLSNSSGDKRTYKFHLLVCVDAELVLGYGNSPYGAIMRDAAITDKAKAKEEFDKKNMFGKLYVPTGWNAKFRYTTQAWGADTNLDRNDYTYFIYQRQAFKDTGFVAYDEKNDVIDVTKDGYTVTKVAKGIERMMKTDMTKLVTVSDPADKNVTLVEGEDGLISNLTASGTKLIRPGIYEIEYTVKRPGGATDITATRKFVLLAKRGDVSLDNSINSNDESIVREDYQMITTAVPTTVPVNVQNVYKFRILDVSLDASINSNDESMIRENYQGTEDEPLVNTYLPIE